MHVFKLHTSKGHIRKIKRFTYYISRNHQDQAEWKGPRLFNSALHYPGESAHAARSNTSTDALAINLKHVAHKMDICLTDKVGS